MTSELEALWSKLEAEKAAEEAAEVVTREEAIKFGGFLKTWTMKGKKEITCAGGNFWMAGGNRKRCSIIRPAMLRALMEAALIRKTVRGYGYIGG